MSRELIDPAMAPSRPLLDPLLELGSLDRLPRTGWLLRGVPEAESIASHVLGTAHVALALAPRVTPPLDLGRVLAMALIHDAPEARTGDLPRAASEQLPAGAKHAMEDAVAADLLGALGPEAHAHWVAYRAADTPEARFVRLCDKLHLGVRLVGYLRAGAAGLGEFVPGIAELDCSEFPAAGELRAEILAAIASLASD